MNLSIHSIQSKIIGFFFSHSQRRKEKKDNLFLTREPVRRRRASEGRASNSNKYQNKCRDEKKIKKGSRKKKWKSTPVIVNRPSPPGVLGTSARHSSNLLSRELCKMENWAFWEDEGRKWSKKNKNLIQVIGGGQ